MDLDAMRTRIRQDLKDTDASAYRWTDDVLARHIDRALREYSQASPREMKTTLATVSGSRQLDVGALSDRINVQAVEYPVGEFPLSYQRFSLFQDTLTLVGEDEPDGGNANVYWGALHVLLTYAAWAALTVYALGACVLPTAKNGRYYRCSTGGTSAASQPTWPTTIGGTVADGTVVWTCQGLTSTIPSSHEDIVGLGARAAALAEYGAYSINRLSVAGDATPQQYSRLADHLYNQFKAELRRLKSRVRPAALYTPARPLESKTTDWGP